jgi:hypothetical protein
MGWQNFVAAVFRAGNQTVIDANGMRVYAGPPAANNLLFSVNNGAQFNDKFGNVVFTGTSQYGTGAGLVRVIQQINGVAQFQISTTGQAGPYTVLGNVGVDNTGDTVLTDKQGDQLVIGTAPGVFQFVPFSGQAQVLILNSTASVQLQTTAAGFPQMIPSADGQTYSYGQALRIVGTNTLINSTTPITLMTYTNQGLGRYYIKMQIFFSSATGTIQPMDIRILGTSVLSSLQLSTNILTTEIANVSNQPGSINAKNTDPSVSPNLGNSASYRWDIEGIMNVSTAGSLVIAARQGLSSLDETFTVVANSWAMLFPIG